MFVAVPGPLREKIAEFENAKLFTTKSYKVVTTISTDQDEILFVTAIFNTGEGLNLIWNDVMPTY